MKFDINIENVNYLKINYRDKNDFAHCIKSAIRLISESEILASAKFEDNINITAPQEIELSIACDNGLYKTKAKLKRIEFEDPYILFSIKKPEEMEFLQNREYFRVKIQENANISFKRDEKEINIGALTYDLSAKGVRIELDENVEFSEEVNLSLFLQNRIINTNAHYIRTDTDDNIIKASFQFIDISDADLDFISQICFKKQLEERRKNLM